MILAKALLQQHPNPRNRSAGGRLNIPMSDSFKAKFGGPKSAQSRPAPPPPPPIRHYSKSNPTSGHYDSFGLVSRPAVCDERTLVPGDEGLALSFRILSLTKLQFLDGHPEIAKEIQKSSSAREAFSKARQFKQYIRPDWLRINIAMMDEVLLHKFQQHPKLRDMLLSTGDAELIEVNLHFQRVLIPPLTLKGQDSPIDPFWGNGEDGRGRNELGKALMRLRGKFQRGEL
ncbi:hypothetical protein DXG01_007301 [Tephrocybe rancida]|nr:hypothetical protein DXG01_007301 [Tephrocybe rancida]